MTILAAVDRSNRSGYVVNEAASLADAFDRDLHVLHVLSVGEFVDLERTSVKSSNEVLDMDEVRDVAASIAAEATEGVDAECESIGLVGDAEDEILRYADDADATYIVMSPRKRSPTGKALFGSVAQHVIINASCPVVTVRE